MAAVPVRGQVNCKVRQDVFLLPWQRRQNAQRRACCVPESVQALQCLCLLQASHRELVFLVRVSPVKIPMVQDLPRARAEVPPSQTCLHPPRNLAC